MAAPPVFLDECVDQPFAEALRYRGFALLTAREAGTLSLSDEAQLEFASQQDMVLLSYNRMDFVRWHTALIAQGRTHSGIIVIPQEPPVSRRVLRAAMMLDWIAGTKYGSRLYRWANLQQELHKGLRLPGYTEDDALVALGQRSI